MEDFAHAMADFVRDHQAWAAPIVLVLAFGESLAFISLLVPAWGALVAIGALIGASGISFWPVWIAGGIGAGLGDWVSYWFGFRYKEQVAQMWPLSRYPEILPRGEAFVKSWGVPSIFIGRFFGPLRASVPLAAGIFEMSYWRFQIANFVSALVWSAALLLFGDVIANNRTVAINPHSMPAGKMRGGCLRIFQDSMRLERGIPKCRNPAIAIAVFLDAHEPRETCMERLDRHLFRDRHVIELASCLHRERSIYIGDELPVGVFHEHKCSAGGDIDLHQ